MHDYLSRHLFLLSYKFKYKSMFPTQSEMRHPYAPSYYLVPVMPLIQFITAIVVFFGRGQVTNNDCQTEYENQISKKF